LSVILSKGGIMKVTKQEHEFLLGLVKHQLESVVKARKTIISFPNPAFFAGEQKYEEFLADLVKKLEHDRS